MGVLSYSLFARSISVSGKIGDLMIADSTLQMYKVQLKSRYLKQIIGRARRNECRFPSNLLQLAAAGLGGGD